VSHGFFRFAAGDFDKHTAADRTDRFFKGFDAQLDECCYPFDVVVSDEEDGGPLPVSEKLPVARYH